jgi:threonine/homoserine/homoserine lactone efflux protein
VIRAGLRDRSVVPAVTGLTLGYAGVTVVVAASVAAVVAQTPPVLTVLTILGAVYLMWVGVTTLSKPATPDASADAPPTATWTKILKGAAISGLNPKGLLLFLGG